jgi:ADP-heptose:LPS heptosyltransferase
MQTDLFAGMRDYYAASDAHLSAREGRTIAGFGRLSYLPHQPLRFVLEPAPLEQRTIAVMLAGSSEPALYPSFAAWRTILDALHAAFPDVRPALIGRSVKDRRTSSALDRRALLDHPSQPIDAYDLPLKEQLAIVKASELFLSPHTGFGLAALATGTPWLTISGGRWFEYYFNHVPFRSVIPDVERFPCFSQFSPAMIVDGRTPSMSDERIAADLDRIVAAAETLLAGTLTYDQALSDYFGELKAVTSDIWSIDGVHMRR